MRKFLEFKISNTELFQYQIIKWANQFDKHLVLNSNCTKTSSHLYQQYDLLAGIGSIVDFKPLKSNILSQLKIFVQNNKDWLFGFLTYDVKNEIENLHSENQDIIGFDLMGFFVPKYVFILQQECLRIEYLPEISEIKDINNILNQIESIQINLTQNRIKTRNIKQRFTHHEYLKTVHLIKNKILKGDIYELNLCQEFYIEDIEIEPEIIYQKLNKNSPSPYSAYMRNSDKYLLCSSPERFLAKRGNKIISQPIKGTIKRGEEELEDQFLSSFLQNSQKERAENIMIVDLVRNDLSKTAISSSVKVEELCKIYTFGQVHQMISTIVSEIDESKTGFVELIKTCFPMGSMTGAPKIKAMELIEKYEKSKRGMYSGCVGYISPKGDSDFNVVIRSILYNQTNKNLSFMVGSAITHQSIAEDEYHECLLKAKAMLGALRY